jgi:hypothetical protein
MFIRGVNDTGDKLSGGVNDTADKLIGGVVVTSDYSLSRIFFDRRCHNNQKA